MSVLAERLVAVDKALTEAGFAHAFGGAIALAYCTQEPRGTRDIDVNVFVGVAHADKVFAALPKGVQVRAADRAAARRDGQVRVLWGDTPLDVFFDTHEFHREVARGIVQVPFTGTTISVLGCESLVVFKAMFNRTKDWADIEGVVEAAPAAAARALDRLRSLLGPSDPSVVRLSALVG